jgi:RNA polymerase sigma-70 factor (ECF subfamily)
MLRVVDTGVFPGIKKTTAWKGGATMCVEKLVTAGGSNLTFTPPVKAAGQDWSALSDESLARQAQTGCMQSFEELVRRYQVPLLRFLYKRCANKHDAEDVLQESFLQAYRALHRYSDQWPFRTWLYTLTCRRAISHGRKSKPVSDTDMLASFAHEDVAASRELEREEAQRHIWETARRVLSAEQFTAIFLQYVEDMPTGQIASVLERSWVSTKTLLHRARRKLQPYLEDSSAMQSKPIRAQPSLVRGIP